VFLLDTNVLSELARARPAAKVEAWLRAQSGVAISVITVEELAFGIARAQASRRAKLTRWFEALLETALDVHDVTPAIARAAGELRAGREASGRPVEQADMLIGATAIIHGLTLATRNLADFEGCGVALFDPFA
jgi:predicted nucleic acid-binding protein